MGPARNANPILTLLTDFGDRDGYVAAVKGVILDLVPAARIVDAAHDLPAHDVRAAAWALAQYAPFYPAGTIHIAVVDPGVGTDRAVLAVETRGQLVLAPDNGLTAWLRARDPAHRRWTLKPGVVRPGGDSATFHGRDVFAYAAGLLARGTPLARLADPVERCVEPPWVKPVLHGTTLEGEVVHVDRFGNAITNIPSALVPDRGGAIVLAGARRIGPVQRTYADAATGRALALIGSDGMVEIAVREGSAAATLKLRVGSPVRIRGNFQGL